MFAVTPFEIGSLVLALLCSGLAVFMLRRSWARVPPWPLRAESGPSAVIAFLGMLIWLFLTPLLVVAFTWANGAFDLVADSKSNEEGLSHMGQFLARLITVALVFVLCRLLVEREDPMMKRAGFSWRSLLWSLGLYALALPLVVLVSPEMNDPGQPSQEAVQDLLGIGGFFPNASFFLNVVIAAPLFEEIIFRGLLQGALRRHLDAAVSILISSAIFAVIHFGVEGPVFILGLVLGIIYERSRSIAMPMAVHFLHNLLTYLYIIFVVRSAT